MLGSGIYKKTKLPHVSALLTQQLAWGFFLLLEEERKEKKKKHKRRPKANEQHGRVKSAADTDKRGG